MQYLIRNHTCTISEHKITYFVVVWLLSCVWLFCTPMACRNFPCNITRVGCHFLLKEIFLTKGSNLPLCISWIAGRLFFFFFFNHWATREVTLHCRYYFTEQETNAQRTGLPNVTDLGWVSRDPSHRKSKACVFSIMLCYLMLYCIHPEW